LEHQAAGQVGFARIYGPDSMFLGVVEVTTPGRILPRRLRAQASGTSGAKGSIY
jgi:hypothetical protein